MSLFHIVPTIIYKNIRMYICVCSRYLILICCSNRIWQQANCLLGALFRREEIKDQFVRMNGVSNSISLPHFLLFKVNERLRLGSFIEAIWTGKRLNAQLNGWKMACRIDICESEQKGNLSWNYILCNKNANKTISMSYLFRYISCWMENIFVWGESFVFLGNIYTCWIRSMYAIRIY